MKPAPSLAHRIPMLAPALGGRATADLLALLLLLLAFAPAAADASPTSMEGRQAPGFRLESIGGETFDLAEFRGRFVVLHFATGWCPFCNAEAPHLEQLWRDYRGRGVAVITIDVRESREDTVAFAERWGFTFPVLLDPDGTVTASYAPESVLPDLPRADVSIASNLILDREGKIRFHSLLDTTAFDARLEKLQQRLEELLEAPAPESGR